MLFNHKICEEYVLIDEPFTNHACPAWRSLFCYIFL
jgi:hypothetical protein